MAYYKIDIEYRSALKAELFKLGKAKKNIYAGMVAARNNTIADMTEYLNDDSLYAYPHEHSAENRQSSSQVRETHGADHFKFLKPTKPIGQVVSFDTVMIAEPDDPDGVGNILLTGARPHSYEPKDAEYFSYRRRGDSWRVKHTNHPGHPSYGEFFNEYLMAAGRKHYSVAIAELVGMGDGIFKERTFKTAMQVTVPGEAGVYDVKKSDYIVRFPAGMYETGGG